MVVDISLRLMLTNDSLLSAVSNIGLMLPDLPSQADIVVVGDNVVVEIVVASTDVELEMDNVDVEIVLLMSQDWLASTGVVVAIDIQNLVVPTGIGVATDNVDADIVPMSDARGTQNAVAPTGVGVARDSVDSEIDLLMSAALVAP